MKKDRTAYFKLYYRKNKETIKQRSHEQYMMDKEQGIKEQQHREEQLYSKEELFNPNLLPIDEDGRLKTENWERLIEQGRKEIEEALEEYRYRLKHKTNHKNLKKRSLFNLDGQLIMRASAKEISEFLKPYFNILAENVTKYSNEERILNGFLFTTNNYSTEKARKIITKKTKK